MSWGGGYLPHQSHRQSLASPFAVPTLRHRSVRLCTAASTQDRLAMFRAQGPPAQRPRRAAILLVVLSLLTLFAAVGLSFVYYAQSSADAARSARDAQPVSRPDADPELLLAYFLGQLVYDAPDDE